MLKNFLCHLYRLFRLDNFGFCAVGEVFISVVEPLVFFLPRIGILVVRIPMVVVPLPQIRICFVYRCCSSNFFRSYADNFQCRRSFSKYFFSKRRRIYFIIEILFIYCYNSIVMIDSIRKEIFMWGVIAFLLFFGAIIYKSYDYMYQFIIRMPHTNGGVLMTILLVLNCTLPLLIIIKGIITESSDKERKKIGKCTHT